MFPSNTGRKFPPRQKWCRWLARPRRKSQRFGSTIISELFPSADVNFTAKAVGLGGKASGDKEKERREWHQGGRGVLIEPRRLCAFFGAMRTSHTNNVTILQTSSFLETELNDSAALSYNDAE